MPSDVHVQQQPQQQQPQSSPLSLVRLSNGAASHLSEHPHHHSHQQHAQHYSHLHNQTNADQSVYMQRYKALREAGFDESTANKYSSLYSSVSEVIDAILSQSINDHLALENGQQTMNGNGNGNKPPVHTNGKGKNKIINNRPNNIALSNQQNNQSTNSTTNSGAGTPISTGFNGTGSTMLNDIGCYNSSGSAVSLSSSSTSPSSSPKSLDDCEASNNHNQNNNSNNHNHHNNSNKPNLNANAGAAVGQFNDIGGNMFGDCADDGASLVNHHHQHHYGNNNNGFGNGLNGINHQQHPNTNGKHRNHHPSNNSNGNSNNNGNQANLQNANCLTRATFQEHSNQNDIIINGNSQSPPEEANFPINELFNYKAFRNGDYSNSKQQDLLSPLILLDQLQHNGKDVIDNSKHGTAGINFNNNLLVTVLKDGFFDLGDEVILEDEGVADQNGPNSASSSVSMSSGTSSLVLDTSSSPSSFSSLSSSISTTPPNALNGYEPSMIESANLNDASFASFSFSSKNLNVAYGNQNKSPTTKLVDGSKGPFSAFNMNGESIAANGSSGLSREELNKLTSTNGNLHKPQGEINNGMTEGSGTIFGDSFNNGGNKSIYNNGGAGLCQFESANGGTGGIQHDNCNSPNKTATVSKSISQQNQSATDNGNFHQYNDLELKYHQNDSAGFLFNLSPLHSATINCDNSSGELLFDGYNGSTAGNVSTGTCSNNGNNNISANGVTEFNLNSNDNFGKYLSQATNNGAVVGGLSNRDTNMFNSNKNGNNHLFGMKNNFLNDECRSQNGGLFAYPNESEQTSSIFDYDRCNDSGSMFAFNPDKFNRTSFDNSKGGDSSLGDYHFGLKGNNGFNNYNESSNDLFFNNQSNDSDGLIGNSSHALSPNHYQNAFNSQRSFADIAASSLQHSPKSNGENYFGAIGDCKSPKSNQMNCSNLNLSPINSCNSNSYFNLFRNNNMSSQGQTFSERQFFYDQPNGNGQQQCLNNNGNKKPQSPYCGQQQQQHQNGYKTSMSPMSNKFVQNQMLNDQMNGFGPNMGMSPNIANQSNQLPTSQSVGEGAGLSPSDSANRPTNLMGYKGLWVCNISPDVTLAYLKRRFRRFGHFTGIQTFERRATNGSNIVFVHYDNLYSPVEAIACLHDYVGQDLCADQSEPLKLRFAPSMEQSRAGQLPTLEQARKVVERSGECFNWRLSSGCHRGVRCQLKHIQINKEIDSQPWVKALKKKNNET